MNKRQESTKNSYESVEEVLDQNVETTSSISALKEAVGLFKSDFAGIDDAAERVSMDATKGKTSAKHEAEDSLITLGFPIVRALKSIGRKKPDWELYTTMDVEITDLTRMKESEIPVFAKKVLAGAEANAEVLEKSHNIAASKITAFRNQTDAYEKAMKVQGAGIANRQSSHELLKGLFGKLETDLEDVDDLMELVKEDHPGFYDAYFAARRVRALGVRHRKQAASEAEKPPAK
jgi:hypothetical protein